MNTVNRPLSIYSSFEDYQICTATTSLGGGADGKIQSDIGARISCLVPRSRPDSIRAYSERNGSWDSCSVCDYSRSVFPWNEARLIWCRQRHVGAWWSVVFQDWRSLQGLSSYHKYMINFFHQASYGVENARFAVMQLAQTTMVRIFKDFSFFFNIVREPKLVVSLLTEPWLIEASSISTSSKPWTRLAKIGAFAAWDTKSEIFILLKMSSMLCTSKLVLSERNARKFLNPRVRGMLRSCLCSSDRLIVLDNLPLM